MRHELDLKHWVRLENEVQPKLDLKVRYKKLDLKMRYKYLGILEHFSYHEKVRLEMTYNLS